MVSETSIHTSPSDRLTDRFDQAFQSLAVLALGQTVEDMTGHVREIITTIDLKHMSYARFVTKRSEDITLLAALVTYPMDWQLRYFARRYHDVDPVIRLGLTATLPFDWRSFRAALPKKSSLFMADAAQHGIGVNGVTIPVRNRPNGVGLVSFTSDLAGQDWDEYMQRFIGKLQILACLIDAASSVKTKLSSNAIELTKREEEALVWAARGKTANEAANIMSVSYASVKTYLENARRKLGCTNVTHAVAAAIAAGVIPPQVLKGTNSIAYCPPESASADGLKPPSMRLGARKEIVQVSLV
jgi:DNA-binding CsgD family transcriptional regulator